MDDLRDSACVYLCTFPKLNSFHSGLWSFFDSVYLSVRLYFHNIMNRSKEITSILNCRKPLAGSHETSHLPLVPVFTHQYHMLILALVNVPVDFFSFYLLDWTPNDSSAGVHLLKRILEFIKVVKEPRNPSKTLATYVKNEDKKYFSGEILQDIALNKSSRRYEITDGISSFRK